MKAQTWLKNVLLPICCLLATMPCFSQQEKYAIVRTDTGNLRAFDQEDMIVIPMENLLTFEADFILGGSRVIKGDKAQRGFNGTVSLNYQVTGVLSLNAGMSISQLHSLSKNNEVIIIAAHSRQATIVSVPLGATIVLGDDRAQIVTGISILPSYYVDTNPALPGSRKFVLGLAPEYGFNFRVTKRLHMGMIGRLQLFQSYNKNETGFPRYGLAGAGIVLRY